MILNAINSLLNSLMEIPFLPSVLSVERMEPLLNNYTTLNSYEGLRLPSESRRKAWLRSFFHVYVASEQFEVSDLRILVVSSPDRNVILS